MASDKADVSDLKFTKQTNAKNTVDHQGWQASAHAIKLLKAAGCLLLFSGTTAGAGSLMKMGAERFICSSAGSTTAWGSACASVGKISAFVGDKLFLIGKYAFLTVSVPLYTIGWVAPKWIITKAIPQAATWTARHIIIPLAQGTLKVVSTVAETVLIPMAHAVSQACTWTWRTLFIPIANGLGQAITAISKALATAIHKIHTVVIKPCARGLVKVTTCALNALIATIQKINSFLLQPLIHGIGHVIRWTWNTIFLPLCKAIGSSVIFALNKIYTFIIKPLAVALSNASQWIWNTILVPLTELTRQAAVCLKNIIVRIAIAVYQYLLKPIGTAIVFLVKWTWNTVLLPVLEATGFAAYGLLSGMARLAHIIYQYVLLPVGQFVAIIGRSVASFTRSVADLTQSLSLSIHETFQRLRGVSSD